MENNLQSFAALVKQMRTAQQNYFSPCTPIVEKREWLRKSKALEKRVSEELERIMKNETKEEQLHNQILFK